jgi:hypothetical protein
MSREIPIGYRELLPVWNQLAKRLQMTYVIMGVVATICSLAVATFTAELGSAGIKAFSFTAALALGLITSFDIGGKANAARGAWRLLNSAVLAYSDDSEFTIQELHKQYEAGETMLGDIRFSAPRDKLQAPKE